MELFALRHTPEGQQILSTLLTQKYVKRGARWINARAPRGWYRNCLDGDRSRTFTGMANKGILSFAFEYCPEFADNMGYINDGKVLRHFGVLTHTKPAFRMGFQTSLGDYTPFPHHYRCVAITDQMLDAGWTRFLQDPPSRWKDQYCHPPLPGRLVARMRRSSDRPRLSLHQWLRNAFGTHQKT